CEDLIFDINMRNAADLRVVFEPGAVAHFRPRSSLRAFFRQYYRYARGDAKPDLWRGRHVARYLAYMHLLANVACLIAPNARRRRKAVAALTAATLAGFALYLRKPVFRLRRLAPRASPAQLLRMLALLPLIRLTGDVAKMAG